MSAEGYFAVYEECHHDGRNKFTHYIGVPLITYALLNFLYQIPHVAIGSAKIDFALVFAVGVLVFYVTLDMRLALAMACLTLPVYGLAAISHWGFGLAAFAAGWVLQFVGHHYEGRKPAFFQNLVQLLIGPLWLSALLLERLGWWRPTRGSIPQTEAVKEAVDA